MDIPSLKKTVTTKLSALSLPHDFGQNKLILVTGGGIISGEIVPVFCGAALKNWGIKTFLDTIAESFPRPLARKVEHVVDENGNVSDKAIEMEGSDTSLFVFKTVADPFVGKMSYFKVMNGDLSKDMTLRNTTTGASEKLNKLYIMRGKKQIEIDSLSCGDIGVVAKLSNTNTCKHRKNATENLFIK